MAIQPSMELIWAIQMYKGGNQRAFGQIYQMSLPYLKKCTANVVNRVAPNGPGDLIDDALQDTYMTIAEKLDTLQNEEAFFQWAGQIATNHALRLCKQDSRWRDMEQPEDDMVYEEADERFIPQDILENQEKQQLIRGMLQQLPAGQYMCLVEYFYNDLKEREIAEKLEMPLGTVKTNLSRAKKKLKDIVQTHEKKHGVKLYSMSWLLVLLFWDDIKEAFADVGMDKTPAKPVVDEIPTIYGADGGASGGASGAIGGAKAAAGGIGTKAIAGIVAAALAIVLGGTAALVVPNDGGKPHKETVQTEIKDGTLQELAEGAEVITVTDPTREPVVTEPVVTEPAPVDTEPAVAETTAPVEVSLQKGEVLLDKAELEYFNSIAGSIVLLPPPTGPAVPYRQGDRNGQVNDVVFACSGPGEMIDGTVTHEGLVVKKADVTKFMLDVFGWEPRLEVNEYSGILEYGDDAYLLPNRVTENSMPMKIHNIRAESYDRVCVTVPRGYTSYLCTFARSSESPYGWILVEAVDTQQQIDERDVIKYALLTHAVVLPADGSEAYAPINFEQELSMESAKAYISHYLWKTTGERPAEVTGEEWGLVANNYYTYKITANWDNGDQKVYLIGTSDSAIAEYLGADVPRHWFQWNFEK